MGEIMFKAFIALPVADAVIGREVTGLIAFCAGEMKKKVSKLNGKSDSYRVAELEIPENGCKSQREGNFMIPANTKALIKNCHTVDAFIEQQ